MALQVSGSKDGSPGLQGLSLGARADASAYWAWVGWGLLITVLVAKKRVKQKFLPSRAGVAGWQRCTCLAVPCHRPSPSTGRQGAAAGLRLHFNPLWPVLTSEDFVLQYIAMCVGGGGNKRGDMESSPPFKKGWSSPLRFSLFPVATTSNTGMGEEVTSTPQPPSTSKYRLSAWNQARSGGLLPPVIFHARTQARRSRRPTGPKCVPFFTCVKCQCPGLRS